MAGDYGGRLAFCLKVLLIFKMAAKGQLYKKMGWGGA